eukprot:5249589-Pyramimonas_sp.AAC.1
MSAHSSHASWPHGGFYRRPQWQRSTTAPISAHFTRFVVTWGAPPRVPGGVFELHHCAHFGIPITLSTECPSRNARMAPPLPIRHTVH